MAGCKKEDGAVNVTIQNITLEPFALKMTDTKWVVVNVGTTYTFENYYPKTLENTQVLLFTQDESPEAYSNVVNCGYYCSDAYVEPPYGGGVKTEFFDLRRERKTSLDGEEHIPDITILAEQVDSLQSGGATSRDAQKIKLRIIN